jgi:hypothetical protein
MAEFGQTPFSPLVCSVLQPPPTPMVPWRKLHNEYCNSFGKRGEGVDIRLTDQQCQPHTVSNTRMCILRLFPVHGGQKI